jgi:hypothetical protein
MIKSVLLKQSIRAMEADLENIVSTPVAKEMMVVLLALERALKTTFLIVICIQHSAARSQCQMGAMIQPGFFTGVLAE